jgi:hypothetical protein
MADDGTEGGLLDWIESGWGDALQSWEHPLQSLEDEAQEFWAGFTGADDPGVSSIGSGGAIDNALGSVSGAVNGAAAAIGNILPGQSQTLGLLIVLAVIVFLVAYIFREVTA